MAAPAPQAGDGSDAAGPRLIVYFVRGAELTPVERRTDAATTASALDELVEGPSRAEVGSGIRTALAPEVVGVEDVGPEGSATVAVTRGFAGITGGNQLLAVAQVVWTLTDLPTVTGVRFVVDGVPVEVPTDAGLSDRPVDRDDYRSVAPAEPSPPSSPATSPATDDGTPTPR
ncbi:GerMN domain-containing protein [Geodermatophilus sp. SYSU D00700]